MPNVSSGTSAPVTDALFAASGPATPSMAPLPNSPGCLLNFFSVAYDKNVGISAPPAGMEPNGKPIKVARSHAGTDLFQSSLDIHSEPFNCSSFSSNRLVYAATYSDSPTANNSTASTTTAIASSNSGTP